MVLEGTVRIPCLDHGYLKYGWGGRIRTYECWDQNPVPYRLATPQLLLFCENVSLQGGSIQSSCNESLQIFRYLGEHTLGLVPVAESGE